MGRMASPNRPSVISGGIAITQRLRFFPATNSLSFRFCERATLIDYDDVALGGTKSLGVKAKEPLECRLLFIGRR